MSFEAPLVILVALPFFLIARFALRKRYTCFCNVAPAIRITKARGCTSFVASLLSNLLTSILANGGTNVPQTSFCMQEAKAALLPTKVHAIGSRYSSFARTLRFWGGGGGNSRGSSSVDSDGFGSSKSSDGTPTGGDNETARAVRLQTTPSRSRLPNISASRRHHDSKHHTGGTHSSSSSSTYNHGSRSGNSSVGSSSNSERAGDLSREVHNLPVAAGDSANHKQHAKNAQYSSSVVSALLGLVSVIIVECRTHRFSLLLVQPHKFTLLF